MRIRPGPITGAGSCARSSSLGGRNMGHDEGGVANRGEDDAGRPPIRAEGRPARRHVTHVTLAATNDVWGRALAGWLAGRNGDALLMSLPTAGCCFCGFSRPNRCFSASCWATELHKGESKKSEKLRAGLMSITTLRLSYAEAAAVFYGAEQRRVNRIKGVPRQR